MIVELLGGCLDGTELDFSLEELGEIDAFKFFRRKYYLENNELDMAWKACDLNETQSTLISVYVKKKNGKTAFRQTLSENKNVITVICLQFDRYDNLENERN